MSKHKLLILLLMAFALTGCGKNENIVGAGQSYLPPLKYEVIIDVEGKTANVKRPTIEEIIDRGYTLLTESTALSVDEARVVIFGDFHEGMNSVSYETAAAVVGREDKALLETSSECLPKLKYGTLTALIDQRIVSFISADFLERAEIKTALDYQRELLRVYSKKDFIHYLTFNGCGIPRAIDDDISLREETNRYLVVVPTLCSIISRLESEEPLHEFEEFVLSKDLRLTDTQRKDIEYLHSVYAKLAQEFDDVQKRRHERMVSRILEEISTLQPEQKAILLTGNRHIVGFDNSLMHAVQSTGLPFLIFSPSNDPPSDILARYLPELIDGYLSSLKNRGCSYSGTVKGMVERFCYDKK